LNLPWNGGKLQSYDGKLMCDFNPRKSRVKVTGVIYRGNLPQYLYNTGPRRLENKFTNFFKKLPKKLPSQNKGQNIYNKAQFDSPKDPQQTTFETSKYLQQTAYLGENSRNLLKQKVAQIVVIILGYFILSKNRNEPPKGAQLAKNHPIWSPLLVLASLGVITQIGLVLFVWIRPR
jgi:hypothetical protein